MRWRISFFDISFQFIEVDNISLQEYTWLCYKIGLAFDSTLFMHVSVLFPSLSNWMKNAVKFRNNFLNSFDSGIIFSYFYSVCSPTLDYFNRRKGFFSGSQRRFEQNQSFLVIFEYRF